MSKSLEPACLLCGNAEAEVIARLSGGEIRDLWKAHGDHISMSSMAPMVELTEVLQYRCRKCGFLYFDPKYTGGAEFYRELAQRTYYAAETVEFREVVEFGRERGVKTILDIGCGHGAFLDLAASRGFETAGIELTPSAAEKCREKGHKVLTTPLEQLSEDALPKAEMVSAFQVLEHVSQPVEFARLAKKLVAGDGYLVFAVPYQGGVAGWADLLPSQWPPHHITRWRLQDLRALGEQCGMETVSIKVNRLPGFELRRYLRLNHMLGNSLNPRKKRIGEPWVTILGWMYSLSGGEYWWPRIGVSVTAIYRVRSSAK